MKKLILICLLLSGCASIKEAKNEFKNEINGFKADFSRVFLKKEVYEQDL